MKTYFVIASLMALSALASSRIRHNRAIARALEHQPLGAEQDDDPSSWTKWFCIGAPMKVSADPKGAKAKTDKEYSDACVLLSGDRQRGYLAMYTDNEDPSRVLYIGPAGGTNEDVVLPNGKEPAKCGSKLLAPSQCVQVAGQEFLTEGIIERGEVTEDPELEFEREDLAAQLGEGEDEDGSGGLGPGIMYPDKGKTAIVLYPANGGLFKRTSAKEAMRTLAFAIGLAASKGKNAFGTAASGMETDARYACNLLIGNVIEESSEENPAALVVTQAYLHRIEMDQATDKDEKKRLKREIDRLQTITKAAAKAASNPIFKVAADLIAKVKKQSAHVACPAFAAAIGDSSAPTGPNLPRETAAAVNSMCMGGPNGPATPVGITAAMTQTLGGGLSQELNRNIADTNMRVSHGPMKLPTACGAVSLADD